jgi:putative phosphoesterase
VAKSLKADIFITGHTHLAALEEREGIIFLNPGSPAMSKREDGHGTIALIENGSIDVLDIVTGEKLFSKRIS